MFCQTYERLFQELLTRDDQANLQPTLNKEVRVSQFLSLILENSLQSQVLRINYVINYFHHSKKKKKKITDLPKIRKLINLRIPISSVMERLQTSDLRSSYPSLKGFHEELHYMM